jgi:Flp pilus assembly protein TadD
MCWGFRERWGKTPLITFGCFTAALFPVLGFFNFYFSALSRVSDHFAYLSMIAVVTFVAAALKKFLPRYAFWFVGAAIVLTLAALANQRARIYAHDEALWRDTLAKNPAAWTAHNNLACILAERNRLDEATRHFEESLKLNPRNASAHVNLGRLLAMRRQFAQAEPHFRAAIELKPDDPEARNAYADALASAGQTEAAIAQLETSLRAKPTLDARLRLADLLRASGRTREAIAQSREALKFSPDQPEVLSNLAWLLATSADDSLRNGKEAVQFAERACQLTKFGQAPAVGTLAAAYAEAGRFEEAVNAGRKAIDLANETGDLAFANLNRQLLQLYQNRRPYHEPAKR